MTTAWSKTLYALYDTHNDEQCMGVFTAKEVSELFDTTIDSLYCAASRGVLLKKRYEIIKFSRGELDDE